MQILLLCQPTELIVDNVFVQLCACLGVSGPFLFNVFTASCQYGAYIRRESFDLTNSDHHCVMSPLTHPESGCYKWDRLLITFRNKLPHHDKI